MKIKAIWYKGKRNFGDDLNPALIKYLSGSEPIFIKPKKFSLIDRARPRIIKYFPLADKLWNVKTQKSDEDIYVVIGSILTYADRNTNVWGPGFISEYSRVKERPKKIYAVRGPLTRKILINQGIECPEIYGDPALLYPMFYKPHIQKKYSLGIIPHSAEKNIFWSKYMDQDVLIIDIGSGINNVVDSICSCECIASSSLHGIIAADAYSIPSIWIKISDRVIGDGFKFMDYFASVGRTEMPLIINNNTTFQDIYNKFSDYELDINLDKLINACPFLNTTDRHL